MIIEKKLHGSYSAIEELKANIPTSKDALVNAIIDTFSNTNYMKEYWLDAIDDLTSGIFGAIVITK